MDYVYATEISFCILVVTCLNVRAYRQQQNNTNDYHDIDNDL